LTGTEFFDFICKQSSDGTTQRIRLQREKFFNYELKLPPVLEQKVLVKKLTALKSENEDLAKGFITQVELLRQLRQAFFREAIQGKLVPQDPDDEPASDLLARIKAEKEQLIKSNKIKRGKELPPIKPEEIPFEIPENWVWCRLGDIGTLRRGKSKHRPRNDQQLFKSGIYPFIQTGDVSKAKFNKDLITTVNGYYNEFGLGQSEMQKKGTLCITIAANIAECGFLDFDACVPDSIVCFTSIDKIIEKYVYYYLKTAKEELEKFAPATAQKNINLGILNDLVLPLPPLSECSRIGAKLEQVMHGCDRLDQRITQSKAQNEQMFQQVLREALRPDNRERKSVHAETSTWGVQFGWSAEP
jgi:type I restriction enzyme S subunit